MINPRWEHAHVNFQIIPVVRQFGLIRHCFTLFLISSVLFSISNTCLADTVERPDLNDFFTRQNINGSFVLYSSKSDQMTVVFPNRAAKRYIPASSFKIFNSLIALETGAVKDENEIIPFGGKRQPFAAWEKDMSMRDAIKISNVPVYQEIARRVGIDRYRHWLKILNYGNQNVGSNVETFWLRGPLKISAMEQVLLLKKLISGDLPVKSANLMKVANILKLQSRGKNGLYGKTGWTITPDPDIGWFVGWVSSGDEFYTFALNMDISTRADTGLRKTIVLGILRKLDIF